MDNSLISNLINIIEEIDTNPDYQCRITTKNTKFIDKIWNNFKEVYSKMPYLEDENLLDGSQLNELYNNGNLDDEGLWQLVELINNSKLNITNKLTTIGNKELLLPVKIENSEFENNQTGKLQNSSNEEDSGSETDNSVVEGENLKLPEIYDKENLKKNKVDFFNEKEMNTFLEKSEKLDKKINDSDLDYFEDIPSEEDSNEEGMKYDDFFVNKIKEDENIGEEVEMSDIDGNPDSGFEKQEDSNFKSPFQVKQEKLKNRINKLEEEALKEKPWPLKGEVDSTDRPINSLLEEVVEMDLAQRPAPVVTKEVTLKLQDIILKRVKDKAYDDVVRKIKPIENPHEFKKAIILDQEKSKLSLAEVYEKEYLKQKKGQNTEKDLTEKLEPEKIEIKNLLETLFRKLDTLSNFHFIPRPPAPELQVVTNQPAIFMEEVAPITMTDGKLLAPEEIAGKSKRQLIGSDEKTTTDRKRERRKKKKLQSIRAKKRFNNSSNLSKTNNVKTIKDGDNLALKTSKNFFTKLQDEVGKGDTIKKRKSTNLNEKNISAKKLKL